MHPSDNRQGCVACAAGYYHNGYYARKLATNTDALTEYNPSIESCALCPVGSTSAKGNLEPKCVCDLGLTDELGTAHSKTNLISET
jgi:hypothetical protein